MKHVLDVRSHCSPVILSTAPSLLISPGWVLDHQPHAPPLVSLAVPSFLSLPWPSDHCHPLPQWGLLLARIGLQMAMHALQHVTEGPGGQGPAPAGRAMTYSVGNSLGASPCPSPT